ncbi:MAG: glycosyltransferase [Coriobacteriia bacterium]|nr:glycosyltransferase [Coriobacteriia bacterium]
MSSHPGLPSMPRVLVVSNMYPSAIDRRFGSFVADSVRAMRALGADVQAVVSADPRKGALRGALKYTGLLVRTVAAAARGGYDVVHAHFLFPTGMVAALASSFRRVPLIVFAHGSDVVLATRGWPVGPLTRWVIRRADVVVAPSEYLAGEIRTALGDPGAPVEICPMGVDITVFRPGDRLAARTDAGLTEEGRTVLFAGTLDANKGAGCEELLAALDTPVLVDVWLIVVGEGPWRARLEEYGQMGTLGGRVEFRGFVKREALAGLMRAVDVVAVPSRREALGLVALEARSSGTPVVAAAVGGLVEHVEPGVSGELYEPGDTEGLRNALLAVLGEPGRYRPALHADRYTLEGSARRLLALSAAAVERGGHTG